MVLTTSQKKKKNDAKRKNKISFAFQDHSHITGHKAIHTGSPETLGIRSIIKTHMKTTFHNFRTNKKKKFYWLLVESSLV